MPGSAAETGSSHPVMGSTRCPEVPLQELYGQIPTAAVQLAGFAGPAPGL